MLWSLSYVVWCARRFVRKKWARFPHLPRSRAIIIKRINLLERLTPSKWNTWTSITYHRVRFARTSLTICKQATIVSFPGVVKHLFAEGLVDYVLIGIFGARGYKNAVIIHTEAIMRPEGIIKSERALIARIWVDKNCGWTILNEKWSKLVKKECQRRIWSNLPFRCKLWSLFLSRWKDGLALRL